MMFTVQLRRIPCFFDFIVLTHLFNSIFGLVRGENGLSLVVEPVSSIIRNGTLLQINCTIRIGQQTNLSLLSPDNLTWSHHGSPLTSSTHVLDNKTLQLSIMNASWENSGQYWCRVRGSDDISEVNASVIIGDAPSAPQIVKWENQQFRLKLYWKAPSYDGRLPLTYSVKTPHKTKCLVSGLGNLTKSDGLYIKTYDITFYRWCKLWIVAENDVGSSKSDPINIKLTYRFETMRACPPVIKSVRSQTRAILIQLGSALKECTQVVGVHIYNISYREAGKSHLESKLIGPTSQTMLRLEPLKPFTQYYVYISVQLKDSIGELSIPSSVVGPLVASTKEEATINKTFEVDAGNNQVLPCRSSTPNDLRWKRGGEFLPSESLRVTKLSNGSLLVRNVSTIDSGYYLCVAPNDRILYNVTINVKVTVKVQMELRILNVKYTEDFENKSSDVYINFAKNFTDTMDVVYNKTEGYQKTEILNIRNGSTKVDFKVVIARVIKKPGRKEPEIKVEVAGKIIAKITKEKGYIQSLKVDVDPETLQLRMAPPAPEEPQMVEVKATSVVIQWDAPEFHKYYHINGYIVGLKKFGSGHEWVNKTVAGTDIRKYILTNLKPETGYYVNVAATNQHGRGVATQPQALTTETAGLAGWAVALIVIVLVVLVAVLVVVLWYRMKYKPQQERRRKLYLDMAMEETKSNPYDDSQKVKRESLNPKFSEVDGNWHKISWENLQLSTVLGSGAFGKVYKGQVLEGDKTVECAVKTLKANATEEEKRDLYKELEIMSSVGSHPNLVNLIGACSKEDTLYIAIEFAANGCLHDYLKNNRLGKGGETQTTTSQIKKHTKLILALDVANGMAYLASKRCIHRDLAARNVLLTEEYRGKIADFGMSRDIYSEGVYEKKTTGKLPVRWMALEAIETFMFTAETDVWSYGVLLWEIETGGITPWSGLNAKEIVDTLKNGGRLEQPPDCNQEIYEIMMNCWDANPKQRPSFKDLADRFEKLLDREQTDEIGVNHSYEDAI